jgi:hypothetical protein
MAIDAVSDAIYALERSTMPVTEAISPLWAYLAVARKTIDAVAADAGSRHAAGALHSSCVRLHRTVRLLERVQAGSRRTAGYNATTLRRSLVLQLRAHAKLEQKVLSQVDESLASERRDAVSGMRLQGLASAAASAMPTRSRAPGCRHPLRALRMAAARAIGRS